jgi:uncharacterized protein YdhG (YjbR/CyaY superfamily)
MAAASIDEYLAKVPDDQRAALERVRREVQRLVPDAEEMISYGMPGFSLHGRSLLWFAGWKKHCSLSADRCVPWRARRRAGRFRADQGQRAFHAPASRFPTTCSGP